MMAVENDPAATIRFVEPLAALLQQQGRAGEERTLLEKAVPLGRRIPEPAQHIILSMRLRLAEIYRKTGETATALREEQQLSRLLAVADDDFPVRAALTRHLEAVADSQVMGSAAISR